MNISRFSLTCLISLAIITTLACQAENTDTFEEVSTPNSVSPRSGGTDQVNVVTESTPASLVKFAGFDFQLSEGDFWEYNLGVHEQRFLPRWPNHRLRYLSTDPWTGEGNRRGHSP